MKECGGCALCCKVMEIPGLAAKGEWCAHCRPGKESGCCSVHSVRPQVCVGFDCFWRAESWPDQLRPDRCKVMFEALPGVETILISVDASRPDAWKEKQVVKVITTLWKKGRPQVLKTKNDSEMFIPKGWNKQMVLSEIQQVIDWKNKGAQ